MLPPRQGTLSPEALLGSKAQEPPDGAWRLLSTLRHDCPHEHACIRCSQLRVDTDQLPRLREIEDDTLRLLAEARQHGWDGEAAGLEATLAHIQGKRGQTERAPTR
jgi:hypothetical protein